MKIAAEYSFKDGLNKVSSRFPHLLVEINAAIKAVDAKKCKTKVSREKTMPGRRLYKPIALNQAFKKEFDKLSWETIRVPCDYPTTYYRENYKPKSLNKGAFREMDFVKEKLGIEVQLGKYAFMVYNVCAKMTIFHNLGHIDCGVEIVPIKAMADDMSTGVSYFEQFVWDLRTRGEADIDIPVLILGIDAS